MLLKGFYKRLNLRTRLWFLNAVVVAVFALIITITSTALISTKELSSKVASQSISHIIDNTNLIQELLLISSKIELLSKTFYNNDAYFLNESNKIKTSINRVYENISTYELRLEFDKFSNDFERFVDICNVINAEQKNLHQIYSKAQTELRNFENLVLIHR